ncbi:restriction endonuclease subunit S [Listeria immobilis]|uniref:restriction endonuclease subunit S n=1 Tax=Listeria immobilis TaxID=2713502 RepID=UPI001C88E73D|nr:restriction endonuclease subunit S [Listeria immobilis]
MHVYKKIDAWEQRELGEVVQITMGQSPNGTNYTENPNDYILVQGNADMKNGQVVPRVWTKQITKTAAIGDIILSVRAPVGDVGKTNYNVVLGRGVAGIKGDEFIYQVLFKMRLENYWAKYSTGSTFESINSNDLKEAKMFVPKELEKKEIGIFFKQLDNTIALHQRKLDSLKLMKKGFLQQMFPGKGEKVPRLRFADFPDEWEQCIVSDFTDKTYGGGTPKTNIPEYWTGEIPWIQSSDLIKDDFFNVAPKKHITEDAIRNSSTKLVPSNSITVVTRVGVGKLAFMPFEYATSQDFLSLSNLKVSLIFGVYSLYNMLQKELNNIQGTSIKGITKSDLLEKSITIPVEVEEQKKIGFLFKQLDDIILFHKNKLNQFQALKKAYLQNMFI